jgi:nicotinamidase-related amidase
MAIGTALVVIDMLNRYEHDDADTLRKSVEEVLPVMQALISRAREQDAPIVYVNDNNDDWSAGPAELCEQALAGVHSALVEPILPPPGAAFITKARHSIFYETSLEYLLRNQGIERLILTGQVAEQCVLYARDDHAQLASHLLQIAIQTLKARLPAPRAPARLSRSTCGG